MKVMREGTCLAWRPLRLSQEHYQTLALGTLSYLRPVRNQHNQSVAMNSLRRRSLFRVGKAKDNNCGVKIRQTALSKPIDDI